MTPITLHLRTNHLPHLSLFLLFSARASKATCFGQSDGESSYAFVTHGNYTIQH